MKMMSIGRLFAFALASTIGGALAQAPSSVSTVCSPDGSQVTLSWSAVPGAEAYAPRLNNLTNDGPSCAFGWACGSGGDWYDDYFAGTSSVASVVAGQPYMFWVHSFINGGYSDPVGASFTCSPPAPPAPLVAPTGLQSLCNASGTQVTLSWNSVNGASAYAPRLNNPSNDGGPSCSYGWFCTSGGDWLDDNYAPTSYVANIVPGQHYDFWIHSRNASSFSDAASSGFVCQAPAPALPPTCSSAVPSAASTTATSGLFRISAYGVSNTTTMLFPTWGDSGGQDDLVWYAGISAGNGTWYADINLANHKLGNPEFGTFFTHVYVGNASSPYAFCAGAAWTRPFVPPVATPTLIEATTFTASCADKYCVKLTGFNFAPNANVEVRRGSEFLGTLVPIFRGRNGDADVLEVTLNTAAMQGAINAEAPQFLVNVVNPGSPSVSSVSKQVLRSTETIAGTVLSYMAPLAAWINGTSLSGWACRTLTGPIPIRIREGSLFGPTIGSAIANESGSPIAGQACGGSGTQYFNFRWPDKYRDGVSRQIYVVADVGGIMNAIPNNVLIGNSPLTVTLANAPKRAEVVSFSAPSQMSAGSVYNVTVTYRNIGTIAWTSADAYSLGSMAPFENTTWGIGRVALPSASILPGATANFTFQVRAPATIGNYPMQWGMLQESVEWFGDPTNLATITVVPASAPDIFLRVTPLMLVGAVYDVSITYRNTGLVTWSPANISLRQISPSTALLPSIYGQPLTASGNQVALPNDVLPGSSATFTFQIRAPATAGRQALAWQLFKNSSAMLFTDTSREVIVATLQDVTPPGSRPPADVRPFPATPPPFQ